MTTLLALDATSAVLTEAGVPIALEGDVATLPPGASNPLAFFALELSAYVPGSPPQTAAVGRGSHPHGALTVQPAQIELFDTLRASDVGYRTLATDAGGLHVYPPTMVQAFDLDRHVGLEPNGTSDAAFGSVRLSNLVQRYDGYVQGKNCDSRPVRLLIGAKTYDQSRGIFVDPPYASLNPFFAGSAQQWVLSEEELEIPLRDATYWADRPLQTNLYTGTGGLNGGANLAGQQIPITRGGTSSHPVQNVPLTAVDTVNLIYQWTDAPGTVVTLYEGGAAVFTYDGDASNLYAGSAPAAGHYRTNNANGVLQLGSPPARAITADVTGAFPIAGAITTAALIARYLLTETMQQDVSTVDTSTFAAVNTAYPYIAGFFANSETAGLSVVRTLLASVGGRMITTRGGTLSICLLDALSSGTVALSGSLSTVNVSAITPQTLSATLTPPPFRWRVGYNRIYSVQTSDFNGAATAARKSLVGVEYQYASWSSSDVSAAWRRPNDATPVETALLNVTDANTLATRIGNLWSVRQPGLYAVDMPITAAAGLDIGGAVQMSWPLGNLQSKYGLIVGDQTRSYDATTRLLVLA